MIEQAVNGTWAPIPGYEGHYEVSRSGGIRSLKRNNFCGVCARRKPLMMKPRVGNAGYLRVTLTKDGVASTYSVHRLVLTAFRGSATEGHEGCHLDGDRLNNALDNLQWGTKAENIQQRTEHGRLPRGEQSRVSKLSEESVRSIRRRYRRTGYRNSNAGALAQEFGVSKSLIVQVVAGSIWTHVDA